MNRRRTIIRLCVVLAALALAWACGGDSPSAPPAPEPARPTTVTVSPTTAQLTALGATVQLTAEVRDQNARVMAGATVTWRSGDTSVATVDASGLVTAAGNGTATITASAGSASGSTVVTVTQSVASVEVSPTTAQLTALGATVQLTAAALDGNGHAVAGAEFSWESGDAAVATVDASGLVTGVAEGTATITASAGEASGSAVVTVRPTFTLSGAVSDSRRNGPMLAGAVVRLQNGRQESMTTGPDGHYSFQNVWGTVTVTVTAEPSYVAETVEVTVDADRTVDFALEHTGIPPFEGTVWITGNILDASDPTSLRSVTYAGRGMRRFWARREEMWVTINAYLFDARYAGRQLEFQVHPEFGSREVARSEVDAYAPALGRMPAALLSGALEVEVSRGEEVFQSLGTEGIFHIYTDFGSAVTRDGFLEEMLIHEAGHISLDGIFARSAGWRAAQEADGVFVSTYARDFPDGEDVAESILTYFAVRYRPERLSEADRAAILAAIPNRLAYFDDQGLDMSPYVATESTAPILGVSPFQARPRLWQPFERPLPLARPGIGR